MAASVAASPLLLLYAGSLAAVPADRDAHGANTTDFGTALSAG